MTKRMFEFSEGTSNKFWEAWSQGTEVRTRYGKIGAAGQTTIKDEGDEEKAAKLFAKLIGEKTKKGYVELGGAPAKAAPKAQAKPVEAKAGKPEAAFDPKPYAAAIAKITAAAKSRGFALPAGATAKQIQATEATLGVSFPAEVRAFYLTHNGGSSTGAYVCNARELLSLENIVRQWKIWKNLFDKGTFRGNQSRPSAGVKNDWWIPAWIPMTYDGAGNHEVLDLDPAKGGKVGQVVGFWHDDDTRTLRAPDFLIWLASVPWTEGG